MSKYIILPTLLYMLYLYVCDVLRILTFMKFTFVESNKATTNKV